MLMMLLALLINDLENKTNDEILYTEVEFYLILQKQILLLDKELELEQI